MNRSEMRDQLKILHDKNYEKRQCAKLLKELTEGRKAALVDIYDIAGRQMFAVAYNVVHDYHLAQDAVQDGLLIIYNKASTVTDYKSALTWMLTVIRNAAIDILRKRKDELYSDEPDIHQDEACYCKSGDSFNTDKWIIIKNALLKLDEENRQIVILKCVMGYSHKEIANMLEITVTSCQKKYQRALKELETYLI